MENNRKKEKQTAELIRHYEKHDDPRSKFFVEILKEVLDRESTAPGIDKTEMEIYNK